MNMFIGEFKINSLIVSERSCIACLVCVSFNPRAQTEGVVYHEKLLFYVLYYKQNSHIYTK